MGGGMECSCNATGFLTFNRNILIIISYVAVKMVHCQTLGLGTADNSNIKKIEEEVKKQQLGLERQQQMNDKNKNTGMCKHELFLSVRKCIDQKYVLYSF